MELIECRGRRLEVAWWGPRSGRTLVLLHEGLGSVSAWRDFPARLAAATGLSTMAYSRFGYGGSDPAPLPRSVRYLHQEAELLPEVLQAAGLAERELILLGHSDGGSIAIIFAATPRPNLRGMILEAPHVFVEDLSVESIARAREDFSTTDLRERLKKHHPAGVDGAFWGWNDVWLDPEFRKFNIEAELPEIRVPLLVIQGEDDPYGTLLQVEAIAEQAGAAVETLILPGTKHAPHKDQPQAVLGRIGAFVSRLV